MYMFISFEEKQGHVNNVFVLHLGQCLNSEFVKAVLIATILTKNIICFGNW
jgi:hypothetical protein